MERPDLPEDKLIEATAWVFSHLTENATAGGSTFRHLIYDRMGFSGEAFKPLYLAGGMLLANLDGLFHHAAERSPDRRWSGNTPKAEGAP